MVSGRAPALVPLVRCGRVCLLPGRVVCPWCVVWVGGGGACGRRYALQRHRWVRLSPCHSISLISIQHVVWSVGDGVKMVVYDDVWLACAVRVGAVLGGLVFLSSALAVGLGRPGGMVCRCTVWVGGVWGVVPGPGVERVFSCVCIDLSLGRLSVVCGVPPWSPVLGHREWDLWWQSAGYSGIVS